MQRYWPVAFLKKIIYLVFNQLQLQFINYFIRGDRCVYKYQLNASVSPSTTSDAQLF